MSIQGQFNQSLGAVAGAAFAIKQSNEPKKEKLANTKLDLDFSMAELAQSEAHVAESGLAIDKAHKDVLAAKDKLDAKDSYVDDNGEKITSEQGMLYREQQLMDDLTAAQKAESFLKKKHTANEAMVTRFKNRVSVLQDRIKQLGGIK